MLTTVSRRHFLLGIGAAATTTAIPLRSLGGLIEPPLYPPVDLSYFRHPISAAQSRIHFAYAAITWGGNDTQAIKDVAEVGFRGIQLRTSVLEHFGDKPNALKELLAQHKLEMVAFSSGGVGIAPGTEAGEVSKHLKHATFVRDVGGRYLQLTDSARPKDRKPVADDYKRLGKMLTEIGKRTLDLGIPAAYHNHMNALGEAPEEIDWIMDSADPRYIKMELDTAHYQQGGGDPVKAVHKYRDRHLFLHIKDLESPLPGATGDPKRSYRFVELGRGRVNLPGVFAALKEVKFSGWCVVELDRVPDNARTPKESARIAKEYIEKELKVRI
jgi:inosose dehydratase